MNTFLFDDLIFGPVKSRRLGASLGINLLPVTNKFCNFNCIYCECGWSGGDLAGIRLPSREEIRDRLEDRLTQIQRQGERLDRITFAGNGEPTIHPDFSLIISDTVKLRDRLAPGVGLAVLSNATRLDIPEIFEALGKVEFNILKLDSAKEATVRLLNQPPSGYSIERVMAGMKRFGGRFILQTMFVCGEIGGVTVDNTTEQEVAAWLEAVRAVNPGQVMIYTIDRATPVQTLRKAGREVLDGIADKVRELNIPVQVSY